ncbi:hydrolase Nlp/P60 [Actinomadura sp. NBRC 104425]|uniref:C40 family peptidase n=1 Tax=Actinomadura sp. NBRC 104425 TaxID=3032204 RepID=UPI0024A4DE52|nr:bifunctional lytic transglycosylase/C40 family peptidase [Actinomadura sp. NBRC 104425]GLZ09993.1 hydrolase Nlp/P60 [Actinomadura sp. NBRC 104425]
MNRRTVLLATAFGAVGMLFATLMVVPVLFGSTQFLFGGGTAGCVDTSKAGAQPAEASDARSIPADYLALYKKAGKDYGIPWNVLAGIGKVETNHGTSRLPGVSSGENYAGAGGPMQFLAATFREFGVDGNGDNKKDRYDPADAIPSAARYLKHNGAPQRMRTAIFMYNHSWDYVNLVLSWAKRYAAGDFEVVQSNGVECDDNELPAGIDGLVQRIIAFAMAQRGKRYIFGANGPDAWDCSSLVQGAYRSVGLRIPRTTFEQWPFGVRIAKGKEQPGDLVFFNSGPGTSPNNPGHVGMVIGNGKMIVASCSTCVPNIGVKSYKRGDWVGTTRPLATDNLKKQLAQLDADASG